MAVCFHCRRTALHAASAQGHTATVKELLEAGADVHGKIREEYIFTSQGGYVARRCFGFAVAGYSRDSIARQLRMLSCLSDCGRKGLCCSSIARSDLKLWCRLWLCSETVLHLASRKGHTATAKALVGAGADVRCKNSEGYGRGLRRGAFLRLYSA